MSRAFGFARSAGTRVEEPLFDHAHAEASLWASLSATHWLKTTTSLDIHQPGEAREPAANPYLNFMFPNSLQCRPNSQFGTRPAYSPSESYLWVPQGEGPMKKYLASLAVILMLFAVVPALAQDQAPPPPNDQQGQAPPPPDDQEYGPYSAQVSPQVKPGPGPGQPDQVASRPESAGNGAP